MHVPDFVMQLTSRNSFARPQHQMLKLLEHLMLRAGETVSRSELHDKVWDMHFDPSSNVIDAHVARLRRKLQSAGAEPSITTRRGIGFVLTPSNVNPSNQR